MVKKLLSTFILGPTAFIGMAAITYGGLSYEEIDEGNPAYVAGENHVFVAKGQTATGDVVIPAEFTSNGKTYKVVGLKSDAFNNSKVTSISFQEESNVTIMYSYAICNCSELESLRLPNSLTNSSFSGSKSFISGQFPKLTELVLPTNPEFNTIPASGFNITAKSLKTLTIPATITNIGLNAFSSCSGLETLIFEGVADGEDLPLNIEGGAFIGSKNLKTIISERNPAPTMASNTFAPVVKENASLYYLPEDEEVYKTADGWKDFNQHVVSGVENISGETTCEAVSVDGNRILAPAGSAIYTLGGVLTTAEEYPSGIYVVALPGGTTHKVVVK